VNSADASARETLFWELAQQLLAEPGVTRGTMMGYPCLRANGAFFACVERATGHLVVKLPAHRVTELAATGQALPFAAQRPHLPRVGRVPGRRPRRMAGAARRSPGLRRWLTPSPGSRRAASPSWPGSPRTTPGPTSTPTAAHTLMSPHHCEPWSSPVGAGNGATHATWANLWIRPPSPASPVPRRRVPAWLRYRRYTTGPAAAGPAWARSWPLLPGTFRALPAGITNRARHPGRLRVPSTSTSGSVV
jgi:hypothetical protein